MKKLVPVFIALFLTFLFACEKEDTNDIDPVVIQNPQDTTNNPNDTANQMDILDVIANNTIQYNSNTINLSRFSYTVSNPIPSLQIPSITTIQVITPGGLASEVLTFSFDTLPYKSGRLTGTSIKTPGKDQYYIVSYIDINSDMYYPASDNGINVVLEKEMEVEIEGGIITFAILDVKLFNNPLRSLATDSITLSTQFSFKLDELNNLDQFNQGNLHP